MIHNIPYWIHQNCNRFSLCHLYDDETAELDNYNNPRL